MASLFGSIVIVEGAEPGSIMMLTKPLSVDARIWDDIWTAAWKAVCDSPTKGEEAMNGAPTKHDEGKLPLHLLPFDALEAVGAVLEHGARVYGARNWEIPPGLGRERLTAAMLRHIFAAGRGERNDPESGLSHMAHAAAQALFLVAYEVRGLNAMGAVMVSPRPPGPWPDGNLAPAPTTPDHLPAIIEEWPPGSDGPRNRCTICGATALPSDAMEHFSGCPLRVKVRACS